MTIEKRKEAISKLYQTYMLLGEVLALGEEYVLCDDPELRENIFPISDQIEKYIDRIGGVDGVYFTKIEEGETDVDMALVDKYISS